MWKGYKRMLKASEHDVDDRQFKSNFLKADRAFMSAHYKLDKFLLKNCESYQDNLYTNQGMIRSTFYYARRARFNPISYKRNVSDELFDFMSTSDLLNLFAATIVTTYEAENFNDFYGAVLLNVYWILCSENSLTDNNERWQQRKFSNYETIGSDCTPITLSP